MKKDKLNLGCGRDIRHDYINVDIKAVQGVDKTFDFNKFPYPFKANMFREIYADNVLEHLDRIVDVMNELHRIAKPGCIIKIKVPYYNAKGAYDDPTHTHYFNASTFKTLANTSLRSNLSPKGFTMIRQVFKPTRLGLLIPFRKLRLLASTVLGEIISEIYVELKVVK